MAKSASFVPVGDYQPNRPYDVGILGRLSAITLSVTTILISRIIALVFHI